MIRSLGSHLGRRILFGYDRYLAPELDAYRAFMRAFDDGMSERVDAEKLHYLTSAELVCRAVQIDPESFGILCCGTGIGMSIAANKFTGIYAARCTSVEDAMSAREINNANVLCIAARQGFELNCAIMEAFVTTPYTGRKLDELAYIEELESTPAPVKPVRRTLRQTA